MPSLCIRDLANDYDFVFVKNPNNFEFVQMFKEKYFIHLRKILVHYKPNKQINLTQIDSMEKNHLLFYFSTLLYQKYILPTIHEISDY